MTFPRVSYDPSPSPEDHGDFRIGVQNEQDVVTHAVQQASGNMQKPGEFWLRMKAVVESEGKKEEAVRTYHVDMFEMTLEVLETWGGVETARKTYKLALHRE